jgi:hypothetical protein
MAEINKLVLCEIYNRAIHGFSAEFSDPAIDGQYLVIESFKPQGLYELDSDSQSDFSEDEDEINYDARPFSIHSVATFYQAKYIMFSKKYGNKIRHPFIRNYAKIISRESYIQPEIAQCFYLSGEEYVAVLKTFWLRLVQRRWKSVFALRKQVISKRRHPTAIFHRELTGKWPVDCVWFPSLRGMLSEIRKK